MRIEADLHLHSHHSDGVLPPDRVVAAAASAGLKAVALTDHDTVAGVEEAMRAAPSGLEVIPGAELSSVYRGRDIHLLAYYLDHADAHLRASLEPYRRERLLRAERIVKRLNRLGVAVTMDEVLAIAGAGVPAESASIGRPHVAEALVRRGAVRDVEEAFDRYLRRGQPAYVTKPAIPLADALKLVRESGGVAVIAHPALNLGEAETRDLARAGLAGIEAWHPKHTPEQKASLDRMASELGLVASGGSDFHGPGRSRHPVGSSGVSLEAVRSLRRRAGR